MEQEEALESSLPELGYTEGFSYLFEPLSHLTSSRHLFGHKLSILIRLSRETHNSHFTRAEMGSLFPQYTTKDLDSLLNSLMDGSWLIRAEGTLTYSLSKSGLLFVRFLPFLYKGDEMDEMAFQMAVTDMLKAAEKMELGLPSLELLRDQIIYVVQRNISELAAALVSRNDERIRIMIHKISEFLRNVDDLIKRISDITKYKIQKGLELSETDKHGIEILLHLSSRVMNVYQERKQYYLDNQVIGSNLFTKSDIDRLLANTNFYQMAAWISGNVFTPSHSTWLDEYDLSTALDTFLQKVKHTRKRTIGPKVHGDKEPFENLFEEPPYSEKLKQALTEEFKTHQTIKMEHFLAPYKNKVDGLMFLAALCSLENQRHIWRDTSYGGYHLQVEPTPLQLSNHVFSRLSTAIIERKNPHVLYE
ncbi:hypothetical protein [Brevibacillus parabrevis]|jgi:hypothetical protein|uniref:hypothetical protein n=1 Tax=Brevibacillus parabrevis TaxID=54914 RepID=UPI00248FF21F|nr:hypothetical protein [Brevibacillus parabrevis]